jgi:Hypervirulence associated proteins TUDOR domain
VLKVEQGGAIVGDELKQGDTVAWKSHAGTAHGKIVRKQTTPTTIKGHKVAASPDNPEFIVETGEGKRAAHKPAALKKE